MKYENISDIHIYLRIKGFYNSGLQHGRQFKRLKYTCTVYRLSDLFFLAVKVFPKAMTSIK